MSSFSLVFGIDVVPSCMLSDLHSVDWSDYLSIFITLRTALQSDLPSRALSTAALFAPILAVLRPPPRSNRLLLVFGEPGR